MKILHTADIHLSPGNSERWDALCQIIELGKSEEILALVISGDLFDADIDALNLKNRLRELFSNLPFDVFIIPGNHDSRSFEDRAFFGANVKVIRSYDDIYELGDIVLTGIPFKNIRDQDLYADLKNISSRLDPGKINVLLYHGELLDSYYSRSDFGDEGIARYMPARLDFFRDMNFDYVLAGHFHTNYNAWEFEKQNGKGYFVYPGSPVSITRRETGKRRANIFKPGEPPGEIRLDTSYYERVIVHLDPTAGLDPTSAIKDNLAQSGKGARILLEIQGYLNSAKHGIDETGLNEFLVSLKAENLIQGFDFKAIDLNVILEDYIYKAFVSMVDNENYPESRKTAMKEYFLRAMTGSL